MRMKKKFIILHEYGEPRHFRALEYLLRNQYPAVRFCYREFSFSGALKKIIKGRKLSASLKLIINFVCMIRLLFSKGTPVILGMAPYDFRIVDISRILKRHHIFYFTSWANWHGNYAPKTRLRNLKIVQHTWKHFLEKSIAGLFTVSQTALNSIHQKYNVSCPEVVVYHSFDEKTFCANDTSVFSQPELSSLRCLFAGRLEAEKGIDDILALAKYLPEEQFDFRFVGNGRLKGKILEMERLHRNIHWHEFVQDEQKLAKIFRQCDILLLPSRKTDHWVEGFGMVIIEAMACGLVVIATDHPGPREIFRGNETGYILKEAKFRREASLLLHKLLKNRSELEERRKRSIQLAQNFTAKKLSQNWNEILSDYLSEETKKREILS
ncbi:MAG TPA: glycosyltransferase [Caldithrix sp.]|nr:glycosyltransferase [Caldithrix sp.]